MFYLTLPSNSSLNFYPDNTPGAYTTKLPQDFEVTGDYEVGLAEIQFANTYLNVQDKECVLTYLPPEKKEEERVATEITLPKGLYESNEYFIQQLNLRTRKLSGGAKPKIKFYYNKATKKAAMTIYENGAEIHLSPKLQRILSLLRIQRNEIKPQQTAMIGPMAYRGEYNMELNEDFKSVYVYCDLVSARQVGDTMAPLLRIVPMKDKTQELTHHIFEEPHYVPLSRLQFNTAEVLLTNDRGTPVSFTSGNTVATLHFRRRRPEHY